MKAYSDKLLKADADVFVWSRVDDPFDQGSMLEKCVCKTVENVMNSVDCKPILTELVVFLSR